MPNAVVSIEDVTLKGDWFNVATDVGRLSTKRVEIATAAKELKGQRAEVEYTEKQVTNDRGTFTNRYLEKVLGPAANGSAPASKDTMIHRQTAAKIAAWMAPLLPEHERTPEGLVLVAEFWVDYFENGPGELDVPFDGDDDIPF